MQKNTAGQTIGAQMVSATDGSAFTGAVTVYVTGDAGTQAVGSVGAGACAHEGNGYHTYAPATAETNYTVIAFTFIGSGAVPATVQVFTAGFDVTAAQVPANTTQLAGQVVTAGAGVTFPASVASPTNITAGTITTVSAVTGLTAADVGAIKLVTDALPDAGALTSLATAAAVATVDTVVDGIQTDLSNVTDGLGAIKGDTAAVLVDTADMQPKLGTPAGVSMSADIAAVKADTAAVLVDTADIQPKLGTPAADLSADLAAVKVDTAAILVDTGTTLDAALAVVDANVDSILVDTAEIGAAGAGLTALATQASVNTIDDFLDTEIAAIKAVTDLFTAAQVEPTAVPAANATPMAKIAWLAAMARNRVTQTATTQLVKADDGTTTIGTSTVSDDGTTFVRGEFS